MQDYPITCVFVLSIYDESSFVLNSVMITLYLSKGKNLNLTYSNWNIFAIKMIYL